MNISIDKKLKSLWKLQAIDTKLKQLEALKGELPLEVSDLEDELIGLKTRLDKITSQTEEFSTEIVNNKTHAKGCEDRIKRYTSQLNDVKNNREYDALTKEVEIMELEIAQSQKKNIALAISVEGQAEILEATQVVLDNRTKDLAFKKEELVKVSAETEEEEIELEKSRLAAEDKLEERLVQAYSRIKSRIKNGVSVAPIVRDSCGGCFSKIPPQRISDIKLHIKILACEHCGRILADSAITGMVDEVKEVKPKRRARAKKIGA